MEQKPLLSRLEWSMFIMIVLVFVWAVAFTFMHPRPAESFSGKHKRHSSAKRHQFAGKAPNLVNWNFTDLVTLEGRS